MTFWTAHFKVDRLGLWSFTVEGWVDHFDTWMSDLRKRLAAQVKPVKGAATKADAIDPAAAASSGGQDIPLAFRTGALMIQAAAKRTVGNDAKRLRQVAQSLTALADEKRAYYEYPLTPAVEALAARYPDLALAIRYERELTVRVERERARYSAWYELFPRSASPVPGQHGTFKDVVNQLPEIAAMGFDILYMPPIHPIGQAFRKGPNNSTTAQPGDLGSPWAIGDKSSAKSEPKSEAKWNDGGHKSIHSELGTFADFDELINAAKSHEMEIALDIAFQCSPDHPWVVEHPDWFLIRPDGTIRYAENPPKKYQDIYPLNFESLDWRALWDELYSVFEFWIKRGVHVFSGGQSTHQGAAFLGVVLECAA